MSGTSPSSSAGSAMSGEDAPAHRPQQAADSRRLALRAPGTTEILSQSGPGSQVWVQLWSGIGSSVVAALATTPFDVVKTRMQVAPDVNIPRGCVLPAAGLSGVDKSVLRACCILHPQSGLVCMEAGTTGALHANAPDLRATVQRPKAYKTMLTIARSEGMPALWRGTGSNIASCIPSVGVYLTIYEQLKARISQYSNSPQMAPLVSGSVARAVSVIGTAPLELMRTQVMAQTSAQGRPLSGVGVLARAVARDGWRSLWRGTVATLYRDVPFSALYWVVAEEARTRLASSWGARRDALSVNLVAGLVAGASAAVTTHPFDVIKTRAQVEGAVAGASFGNRAQGTLAALKNLLDKEGWAALYGGIGPRVLKVGPSCAIVLASFEFFRSVAGAH